MPLGCFVATEVLLHAVKCALSKLQGEPRLGVLIVSTRSRPDKIISKYYLLLTKCNLIFTCHKLINIIKTDNAVSHNHLTNMLLKNN